MNAYILWIIFGILYRWWKFKIKKPSVDRFTEMLAARGRLREDTFNALSDRFFRCEYGFFEQTFEVAVLKKKKQINKKPTTNLFRISSAKVKNDRRKTFSTRRQSERHNVRHRILYIIIKVYYNTYKYVHSSNIWYDNNSHVLFP